MPDPIDNAKTAELLIDHYQKTYEVTYDLWRERNRLFPTLAAVIGGGALLAFRVPGTDSLLIALLGAFLRVDTAALQKSFPFGIIQTVVLVVVFHQMLDLYRQTLDINRGYLYLGGLEAEIRKTLGLTEPSIAFTREDHFYKTHKPGGLAGGIRWVYTLVLFVLLAVFLGARIVDDIRQGDVIFMIANIAIALPTVFYFVAYAFPNLGMPRRKK